MRTETPTSRSRLSRLWLWMQGATGVGVATGQTTESPSWFWSEMGGLRGRRLALGSLLHKGTGPWCRNSSTTPADNDSSLRDTSLHLHRAIVIRLTHRRIISVFRSYSHYLEKEYMSRIPLLHRSPRHQQPHFQAWACRSWLAPTFYSLFRLPEEIISKAKDSWQDAGKTSMTGRTKPQVSLHRTRFDGGVRPPPTTHCNRSRGQQT